MKMPFGKHQDEEIKDLPTKYLEWFIETVKDVNDYLWKAINEELDKRYAKRED